jgi:hypothetical protein
MKRLIVIAVLLCLTMVSAVNSAFARGTRYFVNWPDAHSGPVYVQIYDIRVNPPYEVIDKFKVWVTWGNQTKCYEIGNYGYYTLKFYKNDYHKGPMIISGNAASFKIRYSLVPPWI